jgi:DNA invertase Pin-like site-specific DNA recombinase
VTGLVVGVLRGAARCVVQHEHGDEWLRAGPNFSPRVQDRRGALIFIQKQGWTVGPVFEDDGISGAVFAQRPGLQSLLATVKTGAFQRLVVESQSRIGRDTLKTMLTLSEIEKAGVEVWALNDGKRIPPKDADSRLLSYIKSEIDAASARRRPPWRWS